MQRVYLLLRNNEELGPFTIGELLQQNLQSTDMLWIEGKSNAWAYLSELQLTPFINDPIENKELTSSNDTNEIERKAEELRKKVLSYTPHHYYMPQASLQNENDSSTPSAYDDIRFVDHRKERKSNVVYEALVTIVVIVITAGAIYEGRTVFNKNAAEGSVVTRIISGDEHKAKKNKITPIQNSVAFTKDTVTQVALAPKTKPKKKQTDSAAFAQNKSAIPIIPVVAEKENINLPTVTETQIVKENSKKTESTTPEQKTVKEDAKQVVKSDNKSTKQNADVQPVEKKKTLGDAIKSLFKKKKKDKTENNSD